MKFYSFFFMLFCLSITAQNKPVPYDFFVQYNGRNFSKKVNIAEIFEHKLFSNTKTAVENFSPKELTEVFKLDQNITIHGNYKDSLSYYQVTIPVKNRKLLEELLLRENTFSNDSLAVATTTKKIIQQSNYAQLEADTLIKKPTVAWNNDYFVLFEYTNRYNFTDSDLSMTEVPVVEEITESDNSEIISDEMPPPPPAPNKDTKSILTIEPETTEIDEIAENNFQEEHWENQKRFQQEQILSQNQYIKQLFENGFIAPSCQKIETKADISTWVDYASFLHNASQLYNILGSYSGMNNYLPMQKMFTEFIKGVNFNLYFDNDQARIEETIEYSEEIIKTMKPILKRKINKRIFNYFPKENPLGYFAYHLDTRKALESFPQIRKQIFGYPSEFSSEFSSDLDVISDFIETLVDEKATATLFDGDFDIFVHDIQKQEVVEKQYEYNENFESVETEKTVFKNIPTITLIFTSTHPTMANKLFDLGVRKKVLFPSNGRFVFTKPDSDLGEIFVWKEKDVIVFTNQKQLNSVTSSTNFKQDTKKQLHQNAMVGMVNFDQLVESAYNQENNANILQYKKLSKQFHTLQMKMPKKTHGNKLKVDVILKSKQTDKNIVLQFMDAFNDFK